MKCPSCGGGIKFDPARQKLCCDYCGSEYTTAEYDALVAAETGVNTGTSQEGSGTLSGTAVEAAVVSEDEGFDSIKYTCPNCGGSILSYDNTAATFCSYCGSQTILEGRMVKERKPDRIIPFILSKEQCEEKYKSTIARALFAPSDFRKDTTVERFRGIYMPYWVYNLNVNDKEVVVKGSKSHRSGDYIYTKHYNLVSRVNAHYDGISFDAASTFSDNLSEAIAPYDYKESVDFVPTYLSGFYADSADVDDSVYAEEAQAVITADLTNTIIRNKTYRSYSVSNTKSVQNAIGVSQQKAKTAFFPVWFLSTKVGNRISYAVVNGQTGKVAADIPIDFAKYIAISLGLAAPIFVLLSFVFNLTITPGTLLFISIILAIVSMIISGSQLAAIYRREHNLDDKGLESVQPVTGADVIKAKVETKAYEDVGKTIFWIIVVLLAIFTGWGAIIAVAIGSALLKGKGDQPKLKVEKKKVKVKVPFADKAPSFIKLIAGIVGGIAVFIVAPAQDIYYYGGVAITIIMTILTYFDIAKQHNMLTTRKLPQFEKRGGDEYNYD